MYRYDEIMESYMTDDSDIFSLGSESYDEYMDDFDIADEVFTSLDEAISYARKFMQL